MAAAQSTSKWYPFIGHRILIEVGHGHLILMYAAGIDLLYTGIVTIMFMGRYQHVCIGLNASYNSNFYFFHIFST